MLERYIKKQKTHTHFNKWKTEKFRHKIVIIKWKKVCILNKKKIIKYFGFYLYLQGLGGGWYFCTANRCTEYGLLCTNFFSIPCQFH